jgi:hypothetical protein
MTRIANPTKLTDATMRGGLNELLGLRVLKLKILRSR